jgi:hypothetical protein
VEETVGTLLIYVSDHCYGCQTAQLLAERVPQLRPQWRVDVVDVATAAEAVPAFVIGTPVYVVDGQVISLGNPAEKALLATLDSLSEQGTAAHGLKRPS